MNTRTHEFSPFPTHLLVGHHTNTYTHTVLHMLPPMRHHHNHMSCTRENTNTTPPSPPPHTFSLWVPFFSQPSKLHRGYRYTGSVLLNATSFCTTHHIHICHVKISKNVYTQVCCSMLQYAAVCFSVMQCDALLVRHNRPICHMQISTNVYTEVCCSMLQCVEVCCSVMQCVLRSEAQHSTRPHATGRSAHKSTLGYGAVRCSVLQCALRS